MIGVVVMRALSKRQLYSNFYEVTALTCLAKWLPISNIWRERAARLASSVAYRRNVRSGIGF